jgi:thiopeptide-type bacteriocin biosynthesis protein
MAAETAARVRADLEAYLAARPSGPGRWPDPAPWTEPNNSVAEIAYEPEIARYGGTPALGLAEAHFRDSSELALEVVARIRSSANPRSLRLAYSLQLVAMLAFSAGITRERISDYFADHLTHVLGDGSRDAEYATYYAANAETFVKKLTPLAAYYAGEAVTGDPLVSWWRRSSEETFRRLGALLTGPGSEFPQIHPRLGLNSKYTLVLQSYIHMLLNRLGYWGDSEELVLRLLHDAFRDPRLAGQRETRAAMAVHA